MIGFFDYTVWLTYLSLISSVCGVFVCFSGQGHPYIGMMMLMFSGLCDAFDGKVARTKKDRTDVQKKYGIEIDSLCDLVAFGVLPASIGAALFRAAGKFNPEATVGIPYGVYVAVFVIYALAAMIRLAYFNVTEEERQKTDSSARKTYTGLPVTSAALIFPTYLLLNHFLDADITAGYYGLMLIVAGLFVARFQVRKPGMRGILIMVGIGALEFLLILVLTPYWSHGL